MAITSENVPLSMKRTDFSRRPYFYQVLQKDDISSLLIFENTNTVSPIWKASNDPLSINGASLSCTVAHNFTKDTNYTLYYTNQCNDEEGRLERIKQLKEELQNDIDDITVKIEEMSNIGFESQKEIEKL